MTETAPRITTEKCAPGRKEHYPTLGVVTWAEWYRTPTRNIRVECMAGDCPAGELIEAGHPVIHEALDLVASLSGIIEYGDDAELSLADLRLMSPIHVARVAWAMAKAITEHYVTAPEGAWTLEYGGPLGDVIHMPRRPVGHRLFALGEVRGDGSLAPYPAQGTHMRIIVESVNAYAPMRAALRKGVTLVRQAIDTVEFGGTGDLEDRLDNWQAGVQVDLLSPWESTDDTL